MKTWIKKARVATLGFIATSGIVAPSAILSYQKNYNTILSNSNKSQFDILNQIEDQNTLYMWIGIGVGVGLFVIALIITIVLLVKKKANKNKILPKIVTEEDKAIHLIEKDEIEVELEQIPVASEMVQEVPIEELETIEIKQFPDIPPEGLETIETKNYNHVSPSTIKDIIKKDIEETAKQNSSQQHMQSIKHMTPNENIAKRVCESDNDSNKNDPTSKTIALAGGARRVKK